MIQLLLFVSNGLVISAYLLYFLIIYFSNKKIGKCTGFDVAKDIVEEYNSINIVEGNSFFSIYNLKRKVIKLSKKSYYGNSVSMIAISLLEAGISVIDKEKNKYIDLLSRVFNNLKILYIFPIFSLFISNSSFYVSDAKINIVLLLICSFISYMLVDIKNQAMDWINTNISKVKDITKDNCIKIMGFIDKIIILDKVILFGELIMVIRLFFILINLK